DTPNKNDELQLFLSLFGARTEADLKKLESMEVTIVNQAIGAYREIVVSPEFKEVERLRREALSNEASALEHARRKEAEKWRSFIVAQDAALMEKDAALTEKDAALMEKDAEIARLKSLLNGKE
ncbi:MAG: hypothetical protein LBH17_02790, partial [Oscillospiraceae bacterium]|nr:hypothetical protein [Oscillospiraceae bacterium]